MNPSLSFITSGNPANPPIVFLHAGGVSGWMWQPVMQLLCEAYFCLAPDLPGQGQSSHIPLASIESAAEQVLTWVTSKLPGRKLHMVGLSEGAQVLVALLAKAPECVETAFVSSALTQRLPGSQWITPKLLRWSYQNFMAPYRNNNGWIRLNMKYSAGIPEPYFQQFKKEFQATTETGFTDLLLANQKFRLPDGLNRFHQPVLVAVGKHEYKAMRSSAHEIAAALPSGQAVQIDLGKGSSLRQEHNWALTAPELFAHTLSAWVNDQSLPPQITPLK